MRRPTAVRAALAVKPDPEKPITPEVMEKAIVELSAGVKQMLGTRLNERAIVLMLHDFTGVSKRDIKLTLGGMASLEAAYLKPKKAPDRARS